ncbi:MAG: hypothetical protein OQJ89_09525 [Kangiellaceae bacterium]|nr:hypothetical protein [Kangiellaceae bacterium]MCW8997216.1 hypothetical protein [Kangiellaceae bacterium]MCW9017193.1 hypothetical protein [Kangiellaceae bacterium]
MKKLLSTLSILLFSSSVLSENLVVPEAVVSEWGYKTIENDSWQEIKRIKADGKYYPGFRLRKHCFKDDVEARSLDKELTDEINSKPGASKVYRDSFVYGGCLFELRTWANYFYLEYQPKVLELLKNYIEEHKAHNQSKL